MSDRSILPPNATRAERAREAGMAAGAPDLSVIGTLMNPWTCPVELLPWLAWSMSVDTWDSDWPEETKRKVIAQSPQIHRLKGTKGAVRRALETLDFTADISEWFDYGGPPHTFRVDAYAGELIARGRRIDAALLAEVRELIGHVKPERSHFALRVGQSLTETQSVHAAVVATAGRRIEIRPDRGTQRRTATLGAHAGLRARSRASIAVHPTQREGASYGR